MSTPRPTGPTGVDCAFWPAAELPADESWLSPAERQRLAGFAVAKRRQDWCLGRWVAKQLVAEVTGCRADRRIEILQRQNGSPTVWFDGNETELSLSLSHRAGAAFAAVSRRARIGCDVEWIEPRSRGFVTDYFDSHERAMIDAVTEECGRVLANALWSAKESMLKLLETGLGLDTLELSVRGDLPPSDGSWGRFVGLAKRTGLLHGWWRSTGSYVLTVVTEPMPKPPRELGQAFLRRRG